MAPHGNSAVTRVYTAGPGWGDLAAHLYSKHKGLQAKAGLLSGPFSLWAPFIPASYCPQALAAFCSLHTPTCFWSTLPPTLSIKGLKCTQIL